MAQSFWPRRIRNQPYSLRDEKCVSHCEDETNMKHQQYAPPVGSPAVAADPKLRGNTRGWVDLLAVAHHGDDVVNVGSIGWAFKDSAGAVTWQDASGTKAVSHTSTTY